MQRPAVGAAEHQTMISEPCADQQALSQLPLAVPAEPGDCARVEFDGAPSAGCLRRSDPHLMVDRDHRLDDRHPTGRQVQIGPAQTEALAAPHAGCGQYNESCMEPML